MEKVKKLFTMYELVLCRYVGLFTHSQLCSQRDLRRQKAYWTAQIHIPPFEPLSFLDSKEASRSWLYYKGI